jgi:hypothetical protein
MGVDIYLESVWKPFEAGLKKRFAELDCTDPVAFSDAMFEIMMSSGGYFRNAYNQSDIMKAMGLSWPGTVIPMLDDDKLPIDKARELLALIEARPITNETYLKHYVQIRAGMHGGPLMAWLQERVPELAATQPPQDCAPLDEFLVHAVTRRERLIGLLRKSIELNEPLLCSL